MAKDTLVEKEISVPVLIVGAGAAGARTAIALKQNGVTPLVISDRDHGDAHTTWARGGINAALGSLDPEDSWEIHAADTLDEGHLVNDPAAVSEVAQNMPDRIRELDEWGMDLNKTDDGKIDQRYFGAQSYRRTCFAGDHTGESMLDTLVEKAQSLNIPYRDNVRVVQLLSDTGVVTGALAYDMDSRDWIVFHADAVVLATGGYSGVYNRHSSRDTENTGESIYLATEVGASAMDVEFVQFHPTGMMGLRYGSDWDGRLVTEAVRGEGGKLFNSEGERFMEDYSPKQMELDARDVVARAIDSEVSAGRGTENNGVYLDISHRDKEFIKERLPRMYNRFKKLGVDISEEPMEVAPTAHYSMGGIKFDAKTGKADGVSSLYVVGEATAGVHGANRLGGNSLAETVAIGKEVGEYIAESVPTEVDQTTKKENHKQALSYIDTYQLMLETDGSVTPSTLTSEIREITEQYAGINRSESELQTGLEKLDEIQQDLEQSLYIPSTNDVSHDRDPFTEYFRLLAMLRVSRLILDGAKRRKESRGAHYRTDYQEKEPEYQKNIIYTYDETGAQTNVHRGAVNAPSSEVQEALDENYELDYHHLE